MQALTPPVGFEAFWAETLAELDAVAPDLEERGEGPGDADGGPGLARLSFASLGGGRIGAYALTWPDARPRPLLVHAHGYAGPDAAVRWDWARAGAHVCGLDVRGYGRSRAAAGPLAPGGYVLTGVRAPETSVLRGAVCDYLRAAELARARLGPRGARVILQGGSFAGGLATMAEALRPLADLLVLQVPSLAWTEARVRLCRRGSGHEVAEHVRAHPGEAVATRRTLAFFDALHFAPAVTVPTVVGVGEHDEVVPAATVLALYERLGGPRELVRLPVSHSDAPEEARWAEFEAAWLRRALA